MKSMDDLNRLMGLIRSIKKEKPNETDWYRHCLEHSNPEDLIFIQIDLGEKRECSGWIPKGTYLGVIFRYFKIEHNKEARLRMDGVLCNLAERAYSRFGISYK